MVRELTRVAPRWVDMLDIPLGWPVVNAGRSNANGKICFKCFNMYREGIQDNYEASDSSWFVSTIEHRKVGLLIRACPNSYSSTFVACGAHDNTCSLSPATVSVIFHYPWNNIFTFNVAFLCPLVRSCNFHRQSRLPYHHPHSPALPRCLGTRNIRKKRRAINLRPALTRHLLCLM